MSTIRSTEVTPELILLAMTYLQSGSNVFPRNLAGLILQHVGHSGEYGGVVNGVSPFLIGVAIQRLVSNYTDNDDWKVEFLKGLFYNPNVTIQAKMNIVVVPEDRCLV